MKLATLTLAAGRLHVAFRYDALLVQAVKAIDHRARFHGDSKTWSFPAEGYIAERLLELFGLNRDDQAGDVLNLLPPSRVLRKRADLGLVAEHVWLYPPYRHQLEGLAELIENPAWLLAHDMGTGKSAIVCNRLRHGFARDEIHSTLILCPKSVMPTWQRELRKHADYESWILDGDKLAKKMTLDTSRGRLCIINYDALLTFEEELAKWKWDCIVGDEIQNCKNATAKRSRAARRLAANCRFRYALSGTPAPNGPLDWFGVLLFLDPSGKLAGTTYKTVFESRYAIYRQLDGGGRMVIGYRDLDDLHSRIASCSSRVRKEQCLDLPPKVFETRTCDLSPEARRVYNELRKDAVTRLKKLQVESQLTATNVLTETLRLLQIAGGWVPDDAGKVHGLDPNAKLDMLGDVLEEVGEQPIVIWCSFRAECAAVAELLANAGRQVRVLTGDTSTAERASAVADFREGRADAFIAMVQAGGTGIDGLQEKCCLEIFYSKTYNLSHVLQATDRLHRVGQRKSVTVISLVAAGTVDEKVAQALEAKEGIQEALMRSDRIDVEGLL